MHTSQGTRWPAVMPAIAKCNILDAFRCEARQKNIIYVHWHGFDMIRHPFNSEMYHQGSSTLWCNMQATLQVHSSYLKRGPVLGPLHQIKRLACKNICGNMSWSKAAIAQEYPNGSGLNWNTSVHSVYKVWTSPPKCFNRAKLLHLKFSPLAKLSLRGTSSKLLMK